MSDNDCFQSPVKKVKQEESVAEDSDDEEAADACPICFDRWTTTGSHRIVSLQCGHLYGRSCIEKWLKKYDSKCPNCKKSVRKGEIHNIFTRSISAVDNSEIERFQEEIMKLKKDLLNVTQREYMASMTMKAAQIENESLKKEVSRLNDLVKRKRCEQEDPQSVGFEFMATFNLSKMPNGLRVFDYDASSDIFALSLLNSNDQHGISKCSSVHPEYQKFSPCHSRAIRSVQFSSHDRDLILTGSFDKTLKILSNKSDNITACFNLNTPVWSSSFHPLNPYWIVSGSLNNSIKIFDVRKPGSEFITSQRLEITGHSPVHTLVSCKEFGGLLGCTQDSVFFLDRGENNSEIICNDLAIDTFGKFSCTSLSYDAISEEALISLKVGSGNIIKNILCGLSDSRNSLKVKSIFQAPYPQNTNSKAIVFKDPKAETSFLTGLNETLNCLCIWGVSEPVENLLCTFPMNNSKVSGIKDIKYANSIISLITDQQFYMYKAVYSK